jgi:hypothetical protein
MTDEEDATSYSLQTANKCFVLCEVQSILFRSFLRALEELRKETISFVMSVCPSVRMEIGCQWAHSHEI